MKFKAHCLLVSVILSLAGVAGAQGTMNGSMSVQEDSNQTGSYSSTSISMDYSNYSQPFIPASGSFTNVPQGTEIYAYSSSITGLSSTLTSEPISDFLVIGGAGPTGSLGTTPVDRFDFNLQTLEETSPGIFTGYGTIVDTTGFFSDTAAEIQLNFSSANNYSFDLESVPEPTTLALALAGLGGGLLFARRKS